MVFGFFWNFLFCLHSSKSIVPNDEKKQVFVHYVSLTTRKIVITFTIFIFLLVFVISRIFIKNDYVISFRMFLSSKVKYLMINEENLQIEW